MEQLAYLKQDYYWSLIIGQRSVSVQLVKKNFFDNKQHQNHLSKSVTFNVCLLQLLTPQCVYTKICSRFWNIKTFRNYRNKTMLGECACVQTFVRNNTKWEQLCVAGMSFPISLISSCHDVSPLYEKHVLVRKREWGYNTVYNVINYISPNIIVISCILLFRVMPRCIL